MRVRTQGLTLIEAVILAAVVLVGVGVAIPRLIRSRISENEPKAALCLRTLHGAQAYWKATDADYSGTKDYNCRDIRSFYLQTNMSRFRIVDVALAKADATGSGQAIYGYLFDLLRSDESGNTKYSTVNRYKFGFVAFPRIYGRTGSRTFVVNQNGTVYGKDIGTTRPHSYPGADPTTRGWEVETKP